MSTGESEVPKLFTPMMVVGIVTVYILFGAAKGQKLRLLRDMTWHDMA